MRATAGVRRTTWAWVAVIAAVALVLSFLLLNSDLLEVGDKLASVISCLIALATAVITLIARSGPAPDPEQQLAAAAAELARRVGRQWTREAGNRGLLHAEPLRVRWASTSRAVQPAAAEIAGPGVTRLKLHGDVLEIAAKFRQLPWRKLVVIGAPGAGKSSLAVLLVAGLLDDPVEGEPVPVLVNVAGWNPAEHLDVWLARQIAEQHPAVGRAAANRLVERGLVMPILDGLDEMPAALRPAALTALGDAMGGKRPFVLTCRATEYAELLAATGLPPARAAVVEIEPVGPAEVAEYLPTGQIDGTRRWAPVVAALTQRPDAPVTRTLVSPLMVYLARIVYGSATSDPADLLTMPDVAAIERHLLAAYLPAIYRRRPPDASGRARREYPASGAARWLSVLARDLQDRRRAELAWWEFPQTPRLRTARLAHRWSPRWGLGGAAAGLLVGAVIDAAVGAGPVLAPALAVGLGAVIGFAESWRDDLVMTTPRGALRRDLAALGGVTAGIVVPSWALASADGSSGPVAVGLIVLAAAIFVVITGMPGSAAGRFLVWRAGQSIRGRLPWRLMTFLADAHRRGVLRQVGAVYQFRHARLQEYLADE